MKQDALEGHGSLEILFDHWQDFHRLQELMPGGDAGRQSYGGAELRACFLFEDSLHGGKYCSTWNRFSCQGTEDPAQAIPQVTGEEPVQEASSIQLTFSQIIWERKLLVKNVCAVKTWRMRKKRAFGLGDSGGDLGTFGPGPQLEITSVQGFSTNHGTSSRAQLRWPSRGRRGAEFLEEPRFPHCVVPFTALDCAHG